jgi:hypothetical protein
VKASQAFTPSAGGDFQGNAGESKEQMCVVSNVQEPWALMAGEEKRWKKFPSKNPPEIILMSTCQVLLLALPFQRLL